PHTPPTIPPRSPVSPRPPLLDVLSHAIPPPPRPTLFPYTTLFRSSISPVCARSSSRRPRTSGSDAHGPRTASLDSNGDLHRHRADRKSTRLNSSHVSISYAVFCLKKKKTRYKLQHAENSQRKTQQL